MHPEDTAARYDRIALWWQTQHQDSLYGIPQLERAIQFTPKKQLALEIGCGSSGRFIKVLSKHGFQVEGLDISSEMINLAKQLHPSFTFYRADVCCWNRVHPTFANGYKRPDVNLCQISAFESLSQIESYKTGMRSLESDKNL